MVSSFALVLVSLLATDIYASDLAQRIPVGNGLKLRSATSGGFALKGSNCANDNTQQCYGSAGFCCPSSLQCIPDYSNGHHCCPQGTTCLSAYQSSPQCADDSWSLWRQANSKTGEGYFCCLPGQIGTNTGIGLCVTDNTPVVASLSASLINSATGSVAPASTVLGSASASASAKSTASSSASAATTAAESPTSTSSGAQVTKTNGASINGLGVVEKLLSVGILAGGFAVMI